MMRYRGFIFLFAFSVFVLSGAAFAESDVISPRFAFISGEIVDINTVDKTLNVRVYLDSEGNPMEQVLSLSVSEEAEITDGENIVNIEKIESGNEVDVEYDEGAKKAVYIFVY